MILSVAIQKGGTGKTTTAFNLAAALSQKGKKVLLVSLDSQKNLNDYVGFEPDDKLDIFDLVCAMVNEKRVPVEDAIRYIEKEKIYYIPSSGMLVTMVTMLGATNAARMRNDMVLHSLFRLPSFESFEYIILDCSPSLDLLVTNALNASDGVIVPALVEMFGVQGISPILGVISNIQNTTNPNLKILGILPTMADRRTRAAKDLLEYVSYEYKDLVFDIFIPRIPSEASKSILNQCSLVSMKTSRLGRLYEQLADEVELRLQG